MLLDKDIREPLFDFLEDTFGKVRILEEKTIGRSRADVVMVTDSALYGVEIKSDADTYARLKSQVKDYDKHYDFNIIVIGTSHAQHIYEHVPDYWGIITVEDIGGTPDFYMLRKPQTNPKMKWEKKLEILWRTELAKIQEMNSMPKYKDKSKDFIVGKLLERIPGKLSEETLKEQLSNVLFERDYNTIASELKEFHKGELQKKIEAETDFEKKLELMMKQSALKKGFKKTKR